MLELKQYLSKNQKKILVIIGTIIAVYIGMKYLLPLVVPFLFAYFIAWLLHPVVSFLNHKLHLSLVIGGTISVLLLLSAILILIFYIGKIILNEIVLFIRNIPIYQQLISSQMDGMCKSCDNIFGLQTGTVQGIIMGQMESVLEYLQYDFMPEVTQQTLRIVISLFGGFAILLIVIVAAVLIIKDMEEYKKGLRKSSFYPTVHKITKKLSETGVAYMKTQLIIMSIIAVVIAIGFMLIKNPYAILIGIFVGVFDAFPVLGSGLILIPWAIVMMLEKNFIAAAVIMSVYTICQVVREILEPRLLGNKIGIKPVYNMIAMYAGLKLFGFIGFLLGPLSLVIIKTIVNTYDDTNGKDDTNTQHLTKDS